MKKTLYHIGMLAAAALAFASCNKEVEVSQPLEEVTHVATVSLGKADVLTKTEVVEGETSASYKWLDDDAQYLHVYENDKEGAISQFVLNSDKTVATLTVEFTGEPDAPYSYTAKYAKTLSKANNPLILNEQKPGATSFDPSADVLVSKATEDVTGLSERATEFTFTMGRVVTVNKMTLTGLEAGEVISSVEFTLDKMVTGYASVDEENNSYKYSNGVKKLKFEYEGTDGTVPANGQFPVYFVCAPVEAAGIVSVVVTTDKHVYTKSNTLDPNPFDGKTITFAIGTMKRFTMAMASYGEAISAGVVYTLVESADDLYDGATYLIVGTDVNYAAGLFTGGNNHTAVSIEKTNNAQNKSIITIDNTVAVEPVLLNQVGTNWTIKNNASGNSYYGQYLICATGNNNRLQETDSENSALKEWKISISGGVATIVNANSTATRTQIYNNQNGTSPIFACYAPGQTNANYHTIALYVDKTTCVELEEAGLSFDADSKEVAWDEKDSFVKPTLINPNNLAVSYASSNENVATVDASTGDITFVGNGTTTITASSAKTDTYKAGIASYTITVTGAPADKGTVDNPYTVAEVIASIDGGNTNSCYIAGTISRVQYYYDASHATATYFISDDGLTTSDEFEAFSVKFLENKQWAAGNSQIAVRDKVVIYAGGLQIYQETIYETTSNSGSYLYSLNGVTSETVPAITKTDITGISADGISSATATVSFTDADGWDVAVTPDGSIVTAASISGTTITYSVSANDGNARNGSITVKLTKNGRTDVSAKINVSQDANSSSTPQTYVDVLTQSWTGVTGTSYTTWSNKDGSESNAIYAGRSAGGESSIQLRTSGSNEGVVTTTSGGKAKKIKVTWNSKTTTNRKLQVYGKNTAYDSAADLYNKDTQGTLLTTIEYSTSAVEVTLTGDYQFIGFKSLSAALYLSEVDITWEN